MDENQTTKTPAELLGSIEALAAEAAVHPGVGEPVRELMPLLVELLQHIAQELAEQAKPCPCEGQGEGI